MKVVILGDGLLGKELAKQSSWDILSRSVNGIELTDITTWEYKLLPYDTIINCIAYTNTYDDNKQLHWDINYKAVSTLADYCRLHSKKLVHISTDYVYANSINPQSEEGVPVHQATYYAYTKLLADAYIELKLNDYLILRGTHKPTPFPYKRAWVNHVGNFDYLNVMADLYIRLIKNNAKGIFNVGTEFKNMYSLAKRTNHNIESSLIDDDLIPTNVSMNLKKMNDFLNSLE